MPREQRNQLSTTGDLNSADLNLFPAFGAPVTLELNANSDLNGVTNLDNINEIRVFGGSELRVVGDGDPFDIDSVSVTAADLFIAEGEVNVLSSAFIDIGELQIGFANENDLISSMTVSGFLSELNVDGGLSFGTSFGADELRNDGNRSFTVSDGGFATFQKEDGAGLIDATGGTITVEGGGSSIQTDLTIFGGLTIRDGGSINQSGRLGGIPDESQEAFNSLVVGTFDEDQKFLISGSGTDAFGSELDASAVIGGNAQIGGIKRATGAVIAADGTLQFIEAPTFGTLQVEDRAKFFLGDGVLRIGADETEGSGTLIVSSGGSITAPRVEINYNGRLTGNGGSIDADVLLSGGLLAPGASPGSMFIDGDFNVETGTLEIEIASEVLFDRVTVTGDVNIRARFESS